MAQKGKLRISLMELIYIAYIIRMITGTGVIQILQDLLTQGGNITDKVLNLAIAILQRIEDEGVEIIVNITVVTYVKEKLIRPMVGRKKILDLGFAILTV